MFASMKVFYICGWSRTTKILFAKYFYPANLFVLGEHEHPRDMCCWTLNRTLALPIHDDRSLVLSRTRKKSSSGNSRQHSWVLFSELSTFPRSRRNLNAPRANEIVVVLILYSYPGSVRETWIWPSRPRPGTCCAKVRLGKRCLPTSSVKSMCYASRSAVHVWRILLLLHTTQTTIVHSLHNSVLVRHVSAWAPRTIQLQSKFKCNVSVTYLYIPFVTARPAEAQGYIA